jgi:hypothetical protein
MLVAEVLQISSEQIIGVLLASVAVSLDRCIRRNFEEQMKRVVAVRQQEVKSVIGTISPHERRNTGL